MGHHAKAGCAGSRRRGQRGATLVESAIIMPLLFAVLFGMVDFGTTLSSVLDIRHGAREGARLTAVNYTGGSTSTGSSQSSVIITEICRRMDAGPGTTVTLTLGPGTSMVSAGSVGQDAKVNIQRPAASLTGMYGPLLNGYTLKSTVTTRIEVKATWTTASGTCS